MAATRLPIKRRACAAAAAFLLSHAGLSIAEFPDRPLRLILPIAPGGAVDAVARQIAPKLGERLGQSVVIDNRAGGGGSLGAELTAHAAPDGYTLMLAGSAFLIHTLLYRAQYHPVRDFTPVTQLVKHPYVMVVAAGVPAGNVADFINWAKANGDKANFASSGSGSLIHLTGELFKAKTGVTMAHIPYKGIAAGFIDMLAGRVQVTFASALTSMPHVKTGKLRLLAVTSTRRVALLPDVPTIAESGVPGFDVTQWFAVLAPAHTPPRVVTRVQSEIAVILREKDQAQRMAAEGSEVVGNTPAEFSREMKAEYAKWETVIRDAKIKGE